MTRANTPRWRWAVLTGLMLAAGCGSDSGGAAPIPPNALRAAMVSAGSEHTCATTSTGVTYCWGKNVSGELGDGTTTSRATAARVTGGIAFTSVSTGEADSCALASGSGTAYCWGSNLAGKLGDGTSTGRTSPTPVQGSLTFTSIAPADFNSCAVTTAGEGYCWGGNNIGQLGNGGAPDGSSTPVRVAGGHTFTSVSTTNMHTCATATGNELYCWGSNHQRQLGASTADWEATPVRVAPGLGFAAASAGFAHSCALTTAGAAYCWGLNDQGQVGDGTTTTDKAVPVPVLGRLMFVAVTAGGQHTCGLTSVGNAYCWGRGFEGQLGTGSGGIRTAPTLVAGGLGFTTISAGFSHTCGRATSGIIYCWGSNETGQLGDGTFTNRYSPGVVIE
jgi:alpha-tubulin suppressor-like RCC1 family protein